MGGQGCIFLSAVRFFWRGPLASADIASPNCPIYLHTSPLMARTIPSSPRKCGQRRQRTVIRCTGTAPHRVISICCHIKARFAVFDDTNSAATNERQPWKLEPKRLQRGLFHSKHTHVFIYIVSAPVPKTPVPAEHEKIKTSSRQSE